VTQSSRGLIHPPITPPAVPLSHCPASEESSFDNRKIKKQAKRSKKRVLYEILVSSAKTGFPSIFLRIISIKLFYKKYKMFI